MTTGAGGGGRPMAPAVRAGLSRAQRREVTQAAARGVNITAAQARRNAAATRAAAIVRRRRRMEQEQ